MSNEHDEYVSVIREEYDRLRMEAAMASNCAASIRGLRALLAAVAMDHPGLQIRNSTIHAAKGRRARTYFNSSTAMHSLRLDEDC